MMLEGRTAVVTGVGPGMGRDIALGLAQQGADVALVARSDTTVPSVAAEIQAMGRRAVAVYGNIADGDDCARIASEVEAAFGDQLDILVNSAFYGGLDERFEDADLDKWQRPLKVNYLGTLRLTQALLPLLKAAGADKGDARVVMVNTMSVQHLEAGAGAYAGSKAALGAVSKTLALELGGYGIRVNSVHPGYIMGDSVKISTPVSVMPIECSYCADSDRSRVTAVQPSDRSATSERPRLIIGSTVKIMPGISRSRTTARCPRSISRRNRSGSRCGEPRSGSVVCCC